MIIKSNTILDLLANKHADDVFVSECKDGPSQASRHSRLDAWVMNRSWVNHSCTGYEIKVNRSDFLNDKKWQNYLSMCHELYFVCPPEIIGVTEVPEQAGLLWTSKNGKRLYTKKKAPCRQIESPTATLIYVLMCRASIGEDRGIDSKRTDSWKKAYWVEWMKKKKINNEFGWNVGKALQKTVQEKIHDVQCENERLQREQQKLKEIRAAADAMGISLNTYADIEGDLKEAITAVKFMAGDKRSLLESIKQMRKHFNALTSILNSSLTEV